MQKFLHIKKIKKWVNWGENYFQLDRIIFLAWFCQNLIILAKFWSKFWEKNFLPFFCTKKGTSACTSEKRKKFTLFSKDLYVLLSTINDIGIHPIEKKLFKSASCDVILSTTSGWSLHDNFVLELIFGIVLKCIFNYCEILIFLIFSTCVWLMVYNDKL